MQANATGCIPLRLMTFILICFFSYPKAMLGGSLVTTAWLFRQVADGGDGLRICSVAVIISNKQSRAADKGWSSFCVRREDNNYTKRISLLRNVTKAFGLGRILWKNDLS
jgi:hypothetical protein